MLTTRPRLTSHGMSDATVLNLAKIIGAICILIAGVVVLVLGYEEVGVGAISAVVFYVVGNAKVTTQTGKTAPIVSLPPPAPKP